MNAFRLFFDAVASGDYSAWNAWYAAFLKESDEAVMILLGQDFSGRNFSGANMRNFDLTGSVFSGAVLADADLCGATVDEADFSGAVLSS
ncbi:MAG TPA: pentapeptide repeat-containing protein, partial [Methanocorpusculum sp.]|nr:pentapeptide repeat-containing protein [Methanocorpusculum sp.]